MSDCGYRAVVVRDRRIGWEGTPPVDGMTLRCATCGRVLDGDSDEDPIGDAGRPICGECERERDFFVMDIAADGVEDGNFDLDDNL
jgi:hypothetical protein